MSDHAQTRPVRNIQNGSKGHLMLAILGRGSKESDRVVEVHSQRQEILVADAPRDVAAEAGMSVGNLQVAASNAPNRAGDLATQRYLYSAVERTASGKEHGVTSHQRIDPWESCAIVSSGRTGVGRQTKHGSRKSSQELCSRIQTMAGEVSNAGARYSRQIAVHRGLGTGAGAARGNTSGA